MSSDQVQISSVLQEVTNKLGEAQQSVEQCTLEQKMNEKIILELQEEVAQFHELKIKLKLNEKSILEVQEELDQLRELKITIENQKKYSIHKEKIFEQIKKSENWSILFDYHSYDISIMDFIEKTNKLVFKNDTIMKHLIENIDFETRNMKGYQTIHFLCIYCTLDIIQFAIEKGADIEAITILGSKPFHFLCGNGTDKAVRYFIGKGVELNTLSKSKGRPIHWLCETGPLTCVQFLMEKVYKNLSEDDKYKISTLLLKRAMKNN